MNAPALEAGTRKPRLRRWGSRLGEILTRDYCPWVDRAVLRWLRSPLPILGLASGVAVLCGLFLSRHGFVVLIGLLTVAGLGLVWPWLSMCGLVGRLGFDQRRTREGESVSAHLRVWNWAPWDALGVAVELGSASERAARVFETGLATAPGWRTSKVSWSYVPAQRGVHPLGSARLTCGFPFGLWHAARCVSVEHELLVWPRTFPVGPIPEIAGERSQEGDALRRKAGNVGDVLGVRPYQRGDPLRRIHWRQTARQDTLMVCELHSASPPWVQVVLDSDPAVHAGRGANGSREWAIRIGASFIESWLDHGVQVEAILAGRVFPAQSGAVQRHRLLDALARIGPTDGPALSAVCDLPACQDFHGGLQVVITTDRGILPLSGRRLRGPRQRLVLLRASSFDPAAGDLSCAAPPIQPWLWVDDPSRIPAQLRHLGKEESVGR